jgi:hypothetical protein
MRRLIIAGIATVVLVVTATAFAQQGQSAAPWFGLTLPPGLGDPHRPVLDVAAAKTAPALIPAGEEKHADLQGAAIRKHLEAIIGFSKASRARGDKAWGRITGFPAADATHQWVSEQFKAAGLRNVEVQRYDSTAAVWVARNWEVRLIADARYGPGSRDIVLESAFPTTGSQLAAPITAPLVFVGNSRDASIPEVDLKGNVAVQHMKPMGGAFSERTPATTRARELAKRGVLAVLNVIEQGGNMHVRDFSNCGVPCFNLGSADGLFLEAAMQRAASAGAADGVRVSLSLQTESLQGLKGNNTVGIVPGRRDDEVVIVNAHADGWFDAAGDNGDGLAVLVALARHFAKPENQTERTLVFVASGGHHGGGMNGPSNFVRMNPEIGKKTVLVLNLEHIAQLHFRNDPWRLETGEQPMGWGISNEAPYIASVARRGMERYGFNLRPTFSNSTAGDLGGYAPLGVPRVQAIHSGPMYHTSGDVLDSISTPGLERAARFYAHFVTDVAKAARTDLQPDASAASTPR